MNEITSTAEQKDTLEKLIGLLPIIKELIPLDCMIGITDREKFLAYIPGRDIQLTQPQGTPIPKGSAVDRVLTSGRTVTMVVPKEVFGISLRPRRCLLKMSMARLSES